MSIRHDNLPTNIEPIGQLVTDDAFGQYTSASKSDEARSVLETLRVEHLFEDGIDDMDMARCCLSGLWLLHNFLHPSHEISQAIETREGSWWHAIMHRLEGDFWNSKYWYAKVGHHPAFNEIAPNWDPRSFVDQCQAKRNGTSQEQQELKKIAGAEWRALFTYCWQHAEG